MIAGTTNLESQGRKLNEVNQKLELLGLPPVQNQNENIFTRFIQDAKNKGIYEAQTEVRKLDHKHLLYYLVFTKLLS